MDGVAIYGHEVKEGKKYEYFVNDVLDNGMFIMTQNINNAMDFKTKSNANKHIMQYVELEKSTGRYLEKYKTLKPIECTVVRYVKVKEGNLNLWAIDNDSKYEVLDRRGLGEILLLDSLDSERWYDLEEFDIL